jgi:hypothetical protein
MTQHSKKYRMSFTTGGLFINESVEIARLHHGVGSWKLTQEKAIEDGTTSLPKKESQRRTLREIIIRLSCLTEAELDLLIEDSDHYEKLAILWLAICRAYRLVREFAVEIINERFLSYQLDLPVESFERHFEAKAEWDEGLSALSRSTVLKLQQVLFRMMREAAIISDDNKILASYLSPRLRDLIVQSNPSDLEVFPGAAARGGATCTHR